MSNPPDGLAPRGTGPGPAGPLLRAPRDGRDKTRIVSVYLQHIRSETAQVGKEMTTCLPSKVLHIRNLPEECTELDIRAVSAPFGNIRQILFLTQKQQAFVEFSTVEEAALMLATCQTNVIRMGSRCCRLEFLS